MFVAHLFVSAERTINEKLEPESEPKGFIDRQRNWFCHRTEMLYAAMGRT